MNKEIEKLQKMSWEEGYLRGVRNTKMISKKYLTRLTKSPLQVQNGQVLLTARELEKGLEYKIKKHLDKKKKLWKKEIK